MPLHPWGCNSQIMPNPITVTLVDDYDVVLTGLAHMFDRYRDRVLVSEINANAPL